MLPKTFVSSLMFPSWRPLLTGWSQRRDLWGHLYLDWALLFVFKLDRVHGFNNQDFVVPTGNTKIPQSEVGMTEGLSMKVRRVSSYKSFLKLCNHPTDWRCKDRMDFWNLQMPLLKQVTYFNILDWQDFLIFRHEISSNILPLHIPIKKVIS